MKVSHSTQTANLQLVDSACPAAQEHVETRICNFNALSVFLPNCGWGVFRQLLQVRNQRNPYFSFGNSFNENNIRAHRYPCDHTLRAT